MCSKHGKYHGSEKQMNTLLLLCAAAEHGGFKSHES